MRLQHHDAVIGQILFQQGRKRLCSEKGIIHDAAGSAKPRRDRLGVEPKSFSGQIEQGIRSFQGAERKDVRIDRHLPEFRIIDKVLFQFFRGFRDAGALRRRGCHVLFYRHVFRTGISSRGGSALRPVFFRLIRLLHLPQNNKGSKAVVRCEKDRIAVRSDRNDPFLPCKIGGGPFLQLQDIFFGKRIPAGQFRHARIHEDIAVFQDRTQTFLRRILFIIRGLCAFRCNGNAFRCFRRSVRALRCGRRRFRRSLLPARKPDPDNYNGGKQDDQHRRKNHKCPSRSALLHTVPFTLSAPASPCAFLSFPPFGFTLSTMTPATRRSSAKIDAAWIFSCRKSAEKIVERKGTK